MTWSRAVKGDGGGAITGVPIPTKAYVDVGWYRGNTTQVLQTRAVAQAHRIRGTGEIVVNAACLHAAVGFDLQDLYSCQAILVHAHGHGLTWITGWRLATRAASGRARLG